MRLVRMCQAGGKLYPVAFLRPSRMGFSQIIVSKRLWVDRFIWRHDCTPSYRPRYSSGAPELLFQEVTPCETKQRNVGENFARGRLLSKTRRSLWPLSKSCLRFWKDDREERRRGFTVLRMPRRQKPEYLSDTALKVPAAVGVIPPARVLGPFLCAVLYCFWDALQSRSG